MSKVSDAKETRQSKIKAMGYALAELKQQNAIIAVAEAKRDALEAIIASLGLCRTCGGTESISSEVHGGGSRHIPCLDCDGTGDAKPQTAQAA